MALPHMFTVQGIDKLHLFLGHIRLGTDTGKLIKIDLSYVQLLCGTSTFFMNKAYNNYTWVEWGWVTSLWSFLSHTSLSFHFPSHWVPTLPRENDVFLMDYFIALRLPVSILRALNFCRVYLQVITLSDICSADGTYILPQAKAGSPLPYRTSTLDWPNQGKPLPADWATWRHSLAYLEERGKLQTPLGAWIHKSHQQWQTFYDPANTQLFLQETPGQINVIQQALRNTSRRTRSSIKPVYDMSKQQRADPPLSSTVPATIRHDPYCYPYVYIDYSPNTPPSTVSEDLPPASTFPRHIKRLLGTGNHITAIKEAILANSLLVTTDGSYDPVTTNASYSWVFNYQGVDIHTGSSQITSSNRNAYRTELLGILAALTIVQHIELMHPE